MSNWREIDLHNQTMRNLSKLVGKTITEIVCNEEDPPTYGLVCGNERGKVTIAWIQTDEEGNGSGHLEIEEHDLSKINLTSKT